MIYNVQINDGNRSSVINYINRKKNDETFTVIDVGGSMVGWSAPYIDAIIDLNVIPDSHKGILHFQFDITHPSSWDVVLHYVKENGKFDFCICTHTLEDIMNPGFVCEQMSKIAKSGYIAFPSKYRELSRYIDNSIFHYRGYIHHRWIFMINKQKLMAFPKINYLDHDPKFDTIANPSNSMCDLNFYWKDSIEFEYINNNFLGPNVKTAIELYDMLLCDT